MPHGCAGTGISTALTMVGHHRAMANTLDPVFQQATVLRTQVAQGRPAVLNVNQSAHTEEAAAFVGLAEAVRRVSRADIALAGATAPDAVRPSGPLLAAEANGNRMPRKGLRLDIRA